MVISRLGSTARSLVTAVLAVLVAVAAALSPGAASAAVLALGVLFALGWPRLIDLPSPRGSAWVGIASVVVALGSVLLARSLVPLLAVLAFGVIAAFVHEMARRDGRPHLVESLSGTVVSVVAVVSAAAWVLLATGSASGGVLLAGAAGLAAAALATGLPLSPRVGTALAIGAGAVAGGVVGHLAAAVGIPVGALVGLGAGVVTAASVVLFDPYPTSERPADSAAIAALPVMALGIPVYAAAALVAA